MVRLLLSFDTTTEAPLTTVEGSERTLVIGWGHVGFIYPLCVKVPRGLCRLPIVYPRRRIVYP